MNRGFYTIMAAQFFSSLADNALLIAAIALLVQMAAPDSLTPLLKLFFNFSYVVLAPFVAAFADSMPKGRVMFFTNGIKIAGCIFLFMEVHPLAAYAVVGFGAAAYSPAKYGILTELLPANKLVVANGWIEGTTVGSIILGTVLGGVLINPTVGAWLFGLSVPGISLGLRTPVDAAILVIGGLYAIAAAFNLRIPDTGARYEQRGIAPWKLMKTFWDCNVALWRDKIGQISLAVTTLFWGAGAVLQFVVLKWAEVQLGLPLDKAAILQGIVAFGVAAGSVMAAKMIGLAQSPRVLILGVLMGLFVPLMTLVHQMATALPLLVLIGGLAGFFVVPMNALLQHRGHTILSAGYSIAVQNFNENLNVLFMLGLYALLLELNFHVNEVIVMFGTTIAVAMALVIRRYRRNKREHDLDALIAEEKPKPSVA